VANKSFSSWFFVSSAGNECGWFNRFYGYLLVHIRVIRGKKISMIILQNSILLDGASVNHPRYIARMRCKTTDSITLTENSDGKSN